MLLHPSRLIGVFYGGLSLQRVLIKDSWLAVDTEDKLWLPVNYRPTCVVVQEKRVAFGCSSGSVLLLELS